MATKDEVISLNYFKLLIVVIVSVCGLSATFFGGLEVAKSHADDKIKELKVDSDKKIEGLQKKVQKLSEDMDKMDDKIDEQGADLKVVRTILELRFGKTSEAAGQRKVFTN